jgi:hypothetical protein
MADFVCYLWMDLYERQVGLDPWAHPLWTVR